MLGLLLLIVGLALIFLSAYQGLGAFLLVVGLILLVVFDFGPLPRSRRRW